MVDDGEGGISAADVERRSQRARRATEIAARSAEDVRRKVEDERRLGEDERRQAEDRRRGGEDALRAVEDARRAVEDRRRDREDGVVEREDGQRRARSLHLDTLSRIEHANVLKARAKEAADLSDAAAARGIEARTRLEAKRALGTKSGRAPGVTPP